MCARGVLRCYCMLTQAWDLPSVLIAKPAHCPTARDKMLTWRGGLAEADRCVTVHPVDQLVAQRGLCRADDACRQRMCHQGDLWAQGQTYGVMGCPARPALG